MQFEQFKQFQQQQWEQLKQFQAMQANGWREPEHNGIENNDERYQSYGTQRYGNSYWQPPSHHAHYNYYEPPNYNYYEPQRIPSYRNETQKIEAPRTEPREQMYRVPPDDRRQNASTKRKERKSKKTKTHNQQRNKVNSDEGAQNQWENLLKWFDLLNNRDGNYDTKDIPTPQQESKPRQRSSCENVDHPLLKFFRELANQNPNTAQQNQSSSSHKQEAAAPKQNNPARENVDTEESPNSNTFHPFLHFLRELAQQNPNQPMNQANTATQPNAVRTQPNPTGTSNPKVSTTKPQAAPTAKPQMNPTTSSTQKSSNPSRPEKIETSEPVKVSSEPIGQTGALKEEQPAEPESPHVESFKKLEEYSNAVDAIVNSDKPKKSKQAELMRLLIAVDGIECSSVLRPVRKTLATKINKYLEELEKPDASGKESKEPVETEHVKENPPRDTEAEMNAAEPSVEPEEAETVENEQLVDGNQPEDFAESIVEPEPVHVEPATSNPVKLGEAVVEPEKEDGQVENGFVEDNAATVEPVPEYEEPATPKAEETVENNEQTVAESSTVPELNDDPSVLIEDVSEEEEEADAFIPENGGGVTDDGDMRAENEESKPTQLQDVVEEGDTNESGVDDWTMVDDENVDQSASESAPTTEGEVQDDKKPVNCTTVNEEDPSVIIEDVTEDEEIR